MRRSIITLAAGLLLMAGATVLAVAWDREQATPAPGRPSVETTNALPYRHVEPWAQPSPPFPLDCVHPAYCQLNVDSICTIVYVMLNVGTEEADIRTALAPQADEIHAEDFADCRGFEHYWSTVSAA